MENCLFYDIEVFKHNSMVVFKNYGGETVKVFSSSLNGLGEYIDKGIITNVGYEGLEDYIRDKTLVGYNNYHFDDYILYAMSKKLPQEIIKQWSDSIIQNKSLVGMKKITCCKTLDAYQQISVSRPGLKRVEGNMGISIVESSVDFNIDRELTPDENLEVLKYCEYDVEATINIFKMRSNYFKTKNSIIDMMKDRNLQKRAYKWNTTSIVGQLLKPKRMRKSKRFVDDNLFEYVPHEVIEMWKELDTTQDYKFKQKKVVIEEFNNVIEFGWGGLHGAPKGVTRRKNVKLMDVSSMYPNILINFRGLEEKTEYYKNILETRLKLKHEGKKEEQAPLKLILNSTYGLLNNQYSQINNPKLAFSICIYGQISLYVLSKRLANIGAEIININTDGIAYCINNDNDLKVKEEWEKEFKLDLDVEDYEEWVQSGVNGYVATRIEGDGKTSVKTKGGDVNKALKDQFFGNNDIRITHIALVNKLLYNTPIEETIYQNLDNPLLFQYILTPGRTYQGVVEMNNPHKLLDTRINRVFAAKKGIEIVKKRIDGGTAKFPDSPDKMLVWNDDVKDLTNFKDIIDVQWYYDLTIKNLQRWI